MRSRVIRRTVVVLCVLASGLVSTTADAASPGDRLWVRRYRSTVREHPVAAVSAVGGQLVVVAGTVHPANGERDMLTVAVDGTTGARVWRKTFGAERAGESGGGLVASAGGDGVFVAGLRNPPGSRDDQRWIVVAYAAATGDQLWSASYRVGSPGSHVRAPASIVVGGGRLYLTGTRFVPHKSGRTTAAGIAVALDLGTGKRLWARRFVPGRERSWAVVFDSAYDPSRDEIDVALELDETPTRESLTLLSLEGATGHRSWRAHWSAPERGSSVVHPRSILVDPVRHVAYVGGDFAGGAGVVVAFRTGSGNHLWKTTIGRPRDGRVEFLTLERSGSALLGAASEWSLNALHGYAFAIDARSGAVTWNKRVVPSSDEWDTPPVGGRLSSAGDLVVAFARTPVPCENDPCVPSPTNSDFLTAAFDPSNGTVLWRDAYGTDARQFPAGIAETLGGTAVCGSFAGPERADIACVDYAA